MTDTGKTYSESWRSAWPDALAFAGGLTLAWFNGWATRDLVWSLWLSSLVVGYAMIVWNIFGPGRQLLRQSENREAPARSQVVVGGVYLFGGLFMLAFFTVHFGGFHLVHSVFLNAFFPVTEDGARGMPGAALYWQVVREYWPFVLVAAVAERQAFKRSDPVTMVDDLSVTEPASATRKARSGGGDQMMGPYKNVIRLHLLIFFFAFASFTGLDGFLVYAVVYAVYFFPWRLLKKN